MLKSLNAEAYPVKTLAEIDSVRGLVLPGGESTTIGKLLVLHGLFDPLRERIMAGLPIFGTCAGLILLSKKALGSSQPLLEVLDVDVQRNAYGRQIESFETQVELLWGAQAQSSAIFIRAPQIVRLGESVKVLARHENRPVAVQQGKILAASYHPELTENTALHQLFLSLI
jgi:5'-phosphate synthase pdxT subunit